MDLPRIFVTAGTLLLAGSGIWAGQRITQPNDHPEPAGWYAGDAHVHLDCGVGSGHDPVSPEQTLAAMKIHNLAVVSLLADMGNGEVRGQRGICR